MANPEVIYTRLGQDANNNVTGFYVQLGGPGGQSYDIIQMNMAYAVNEIPTAKVLLGTGRSIGGTRRGISQNPGGLDQYQTMTQAKIFLGISGDFAPGIPWPAPEDGGPVYTIFDGYLAGFSIDGSQDRMMASLDLVHWSVDLTFSTCLIGGLMPASAGGLADALIKNQLNSKDGVKGNYTTVGGINSSLTAQGVFDDLWGSLKNLFAEMSTQNLQLANLAALAPSTLSSNARAQKALARIEGPTPSVAAASKPYQYAVPTALNSQLSGAAAIAQSIPNYIGRSASASYLGGSFWDKAVQELLPAFGLAFVPMVSRGLVIADTPMYSARAWRTVTPDQYSEIRQPRELSKPVRGVAVMSPGTIGLQGAIVSQIDPNSKLISGYYSANSVSADDGHILFVPPPPWLSLLSNFEQSLAGGGGRIGSGFSNFVGALETPAAPGKPLPSDDPKTLQTIYGLWAQHVFAQNAMRGSTGLISGKLRFDIAPGSGIILEKRSETFLGAEDSLSGTLWANVQRVNYSIDCENRAASTAFQLGYCRTASENATPRGGIARNPLFGSSIHGGGAGGAPMIEGHENLDS